MLSLRHSNGRWGIKLVANALLVHEAKRRKLKPDNATVDQQLQNYEQRFANDPKWPEARKRVLPIITKKLQDEDIRNQLEKLVRNVPPPTQQQLRQYYDAHADKFTSPPQPRVSVILIRVDPSSTEEEWNKAMEEGEGLVKRLRAGEDFATMAHDYSGDVTAEEGGDMGYLHSGMLPGLPEEIVSKLQPGETADPTKLLEGVAIFRLTDRIQPAASSFEASQQRVSELWLSEQAILRGTPSSRSSGRKRPFTWMSRASCHSPPLPKSLLKNDGAALPVETK